MILYFPLISAVFMLKTPTCYAHSPYPCAKRKRRLTIELVVRSAADDKMAPGSLRLSVIRMRREENDGVAVSKTCSSIASTSRQDGSTHWWRMGPSLRDHGALLSARREDGAYLTGDADLDCTVAELSFVSATCYGTARTALPLIGPWCSRIAPVLRV